MDVWESHSLPFDLPQNNILNSRRGWAWKTKVKLGGEVILEPASARWPIFGVWRTRKCCCTKDHEFLARRSPRKVVVPRIMNSWPDKVQRKVVVPRIMNSWPDKDQS